MPNDVSMKKPAVSAGGDHGADLVLGPLTRAGRFVSFGGVRLEDNAAMESCSNKASAIRIC